MATPFRLKRSAVASKRPETTNLQLGELALNTYDGYLYTEREGVGLATVTNLTPWYENYGGDSIYYGNTVGIGTTNPTQKLDVRGNAIFLNSGNDTNISIGETVGNNNAYIDFRGDSTYTDYGLRVLRNDGGANATSDFRHRGTGAIRIAAEDAGSIKFFTSGTGASNERLSITSTGDVGINSTAPAAKLDVIGDVKIDGKLRINPDDSNTTWQRELSTIHQIRDDIYLESTLNVGDKAGFDFAPLTISAFSYSGTTLTLTTASHSIGVGKNILIKDSASGFHEVFNTISGTTGTTIKVTRDSDPSSSLSTANTKVTVYTPTDPRGCVNVAKDYAKFDQNTFNPILRGFVGISTTSSTAPNTEVFKIEIKKDASAADHVATLLHSTREFGAGQRIALTIDDGESYPDGKSLVLTQTGVKITTDDSAFTDSDELLEVEGNAKIDGNLNVTGITTTVQLKVGTNPTVGITTILDEDNMASDSAAALATQQSIKAYVDSQVTAQDLDVTSDNGTIDIDLDSETLDIAGTANEIETSASGNEVTIGLPNNVTIGNNLIVTNDVGIGSAIPSAKLDVVGAVKATSFSGSGANLTALNIVSDTTPQLGGNLDINSKNVQFGDSPDGNSSNVLSFGGEGDLKIYHDTVHSRIVDTGTGDLKLQSSKVTIGNAGNTETIATFIENGVGIAGSITVSNDLSVTGISTISGNLVVGAAGTTITTTVGAAASVGIGTANPAYMLDVAGAINSSNDVKINGTSVLTSALNEAVAMAIALG